MHLRLSLLGCAVILIGRALTLPPGELWRDWVSIVAVYAAHSALASKTAAWPAVTTAVMSILLGIYASGQMVRMVRLAWGEG